jgi:adenine-specific DNA-methyltransferase
MSAPPIGHILQGDCIGRMQAMQSQSVDFILTDPPYVARYRSRDGRKVANDAAGFRPVGHIMFRKRYASSVRFLRYQHEAAYLLAKGNVNPPVTSGLNLT